MSDLIDDIFGDSAPSDPKRRRRRDRNADPVKSAEVETHRPGPPLPAFEELEKMDEDDYLPFGPVADTESFRHRAERRVRERQPEALFDIIEAEIPNTVLLEMESADARMLSVIPVSADEDSVTLACVDPTDVDLMVRLRPIIVGKRISLVRAEPHLIRRRIDKEYSAQHEATKVAMEMASVEASSDERLETGMDLGNVGTGEGANNRLLRLIVEQAIREGASDVHMEPVAHGFEIRMRVDGKLHLRGSYGRDVESGLTTLVKVEAKMATDNKHRPDSGVLSFQPKGYTKAVDIRVETTPCAWGQGVVMRLQNEVWRDLSTLGFSPENEKRFRAAIAAPYGVLLATGPTGSGKLFTLSTPVATPTGSTTMGEIQVGDSALGRDGNPCLVTDVWPINKTPDLYRVNMSDGQSMVADFDHQWLVSTHHGRSVPRTKKRLAAIERHQKALANADLLDVAASTVGSEPATVAELFNLLTAVGDTEHPSPDMIRAALASTDCPFVESTRSKPRTDVTVREQTMVLYPVKPVLEAIERHSASWGPAATTVLAGSYPDEAKCQDICALLGLDSNWLARDMVLREGIVGREVTVEQQYERETAGTVSVLEFPADVAFKSLALRLRQRFSHAPSAEADLQRMTTGEMLATGIRSGEHSNFAVPVAAPLHLPEADLPVPPYTLGAWLGDGTSASDGFTGIDPEIWQAIEADGFEVTHGSLPKIHRIRGLVPGLRSAGVLNNKHIPDTYLRASYDQRLALLQGLMDTDGTISAGGACELSLSDKPLATDALELIRSLGIKASCSWDQPASYRDTNGEVVVCKDRHRIKFTTTTQVFGLGRKAERVPSSVRETQGWLYITSVEPVLPGDRDYEPGRCITVDSADRTYLCGDGFVVTSNTTTLYSALRERIDVENKIITLENPIEYKIPSGVTQIAVNEAQNMTFARGLRSILRQDPDIVLVGEIRDGETAETAVDAAMTGHLVLSTLHTNDAVGALPRMARLGIEPFLLSSSILGVVGQRLVRRLCEHCKVEAQEVINGEKHDVFTNNIAGCSECFAGFSGRVPIHEVLTVTPDMRDLIADDAAQSVLQRAAREAGMTTMREDGFFKVLEGTTSVSEVLSSTRE